MQADQNGIHIGKDGWLFLVAGSNEALRLLTDSEWFVREDARNWALKLADREKRLSALGAQYFHMWVPDKIKVYQDQLNFDNRILKVDPPGMVIEFARDWGLDGVIVDPLPALMGSKDDQLLYWKTDTHWTYWGACAAHKALCHAIDVDPPDDLWNRPIHSATLALDLGSKLSPPLKEAWGGAQVLQSSKIVYKNELVRFLEILNPAHTGPMLRGTSVRFENSRSGVDERRVLLFGDSFSEYRPHLLSGLLAETFRHVLFIWSTSIDYHVVEKFRPDIVITEMAERFIKDRPEKNIQEDGFDLASFVLTRIVGFLNSQCGNGCHPFIWSRDALARMDSRYD
jgi:alginate O-acetyltransferase complex protein AlgJ